MRTPPGVVGITPAVRPGLSNKENKRGVWDASQLHSFTVPPLSEDAICPHPAPSHSGHLAA